MELVIAIDIGGTNIKGGIVGDGKIRDYVKVPTGAEGGFNLIKERIYSVVETLLQKCPKPCAIGVSSAGTINPNTGEVIYATQNLPGFTGYKIKDDLQERFNIAVFAINDGYAALLGEQAYGAAKGEKDCLMLTFGTGLGGAAILSGQIVYGAHFGAARLGHTVLHPKGKKCTCGGKGCAEQYLSVTAIMRDLKEKGVDAVSLEILRDESNAAVQQVLKSFIANLEMLITNLIFTYDPSAIIFGGGLIYFAEYWLDDIASKFPNVALRSAMLENDAGIIGAAVFATQKLSLV